MVQRVAVYGALAGVVTLLFLAVYSLALAGASTQLGDTRLRWIALVVAAAAAVVLLAEPARRWLGARLEWRFLESGTSRSARWLACRIESSMAAERRRTCWTRWPIRSLLRSGLRRLRWQSIVVRRWKRSR